MPALKLALGLVALLNAAHAATLQGTPMEKVVQILAEVKAKVEKDGKAEQVSYDKYACWCEDTLGSKASDISGAKTEIEETQDLIIKTKAELGSHTASVAQLKKQIAANVASEREATEMRNKAHGEYAEERSESENCIGALEAAVKVLTGAGAKKGFLETLQEAHILGVVAGIKDVLKTSEVTKKFSSDEIATVEKFAEKPDDYLGGRTTGFSAAQVENNPFGDYAPQSTQIQGILKGMYDTFAQDLEKNNAEEAEQQKSHEALIATKKSELATLEATLERTELDSAAATKTLADSKSTLDDTKEQLEADETFFADSKEACKSKAKQWAERTRLRTEELSGMQQAIAIMSSDDAKATFKSATTTFLQTSSSEDSDRIKAYHRVQGLATTMKSLSLARIAVAIKTNTGGHFDKVITMIDTMIALMRKEEAEDIAHRDRCERKQNANANNEDDLNNDITKAKEELKRQGNTETELKAAKLKMETEIAATKKSMDDLKTSRNKEESDFKQALEDDANAVSLISQAIAALTKFYADNKAALLQAPPPATFKDGNYGGSSSTGGVVAILEMLKEDLMKEMKVGKSDDGTSQESYETVRDAFQNTLDAQEKKMVDIETTAAALNLKIEDGDENKESKQADLAANDKVKASLATDCDWVKNTFATRKEKRALEVDGLQEAKDFLAGVDQGAAVLGP